ncbi:citrate lyase holo-[acyl-carrier protein] synthase [Photobacterium sanguinicancri]|uniref:citrate lyase holo-[acyl-carrier protein] synthase n=1 Tax=Photobacterium sanguinicancri TaxID=875932 RepID=UPI0021C3C0AE|nr:citrate lyase holo-[acyl-carrier protein] synthase [Photobacterium sanguinicancri]
MFGGVKVSALDVMAFNDAIAELQCNWLSQYGGVLVSFTVNMAGPIKVNKASSVVFEQGCQAINHVCSNTPLNIINHHQIQTHAGFHYLIALNNAPDNNFDAIALKKQLIQLESTHPLGRLMDIDVLNGSLRPLSRSNIGLPSRRCIICDDDAKNCARSRRHSLQNLYMEIEEMLTQ